MAKMRIKCNGCKKKISVDEAFAGGMCRCPYCKAIVKVPERAGAAAGAGSSRPDRPSRPDAPPGRPGSPAGARQGPERATKVKVLGPEDIPMADPVKVQGVVTILLFLCLIIMGAVGGYAIWKIMNQENPHDKPFVMPANDNSNPFMANTVPAVAGNIKVEPPVIYVLDCGSRMGEPMGYASKMVRASVKSLPKGQKFNILLLRDGGNKWMVDGLEFAGPDGLAKARQETKDIIPSGRTELAAGIKQALDAKPKTLVVLANKQIEDKDVNELAAAAKSGGTVIVAISICVGSEEDVVKSFSRLSEQTGGKSRAFSMAELDTFNNSSDAVD
ncbi:MAG: hypothetical protein HZA50_06825 [Planctomycetes bacterium]|nr:hypothetical protein [Planctomycetota bacterium]